MARRLSALVLLAAAAACAGCHIPLDGPAWAPIVHTTTPAFVGEQSAGMSKVGEAKWEGILLIAKGDASLATAMKKGEITRIHHADRQQLHVLGIYTQEIIRVYGE